MSGEQGGSRSENQITERDVEMTRERIAVLRERVDTVKQALADMVARSRDSSQDDGAVLTAEKQKYWDE